MTNANQNNAGPTPDLAAMLSSLSDSEPALGSRRVRAKQDEMISARLGVAAGLFTALRAKHECTALHCLRVALGCSAWSLLMDMKASQRDALEIAALLHDVGKIGVPDAVLLKPSKLHGEEVTSMEEQRIIGQQILAACSSSADVLEIVHYSGVWFDGTGSDSDLTGKDLPLGSRILAIVDAYDSMTTDHVFRRAMPRERVLGELYNGAGSQFDPNLVHDFCSLTEADRKRLDESVSSRWLHELRPTDAIWAPGPQICGGDDVSSLFYTRLAESMHDALVFVDSYLKVEKWNRAAERLTGITAESIAGSCWTPSIVDMHDDEKNPIIEEECPVRLAIESGVQSLERVTLVDPKGERRGVNMHVIPVWSGHGLTQGAVILLHDASSQITLEERVHKLHVKATQDPLTKVGNRAEFDRVHAEIVSTHQNEGAPCSLIICDIDHFKRVNDNYGHQAGDEALVSFASVLQAFTRSGDFVARYGGEEFVLLCADCDHHSATRRAEEIRSRLSMMPQPMLKNMCITASFGVTSLQAGDTPESMLARADRALLQAKDSGRNRVVQLGTGVQEEAQVAETKSGWFSFLDTSSEMMIERVMHTAVPLEVAVEKLRGFVADHRAEIVNVAENQVCLNIDSRHMPNRREGDRIVAFVIDIRFQHDERSRRGTDIHLRIRPKRRRDRRLKDIEFRAMQFLGSVKAYFMASECELPEDVKQQGLFV